MLPAEFPESGADMSVTRQSRSGSENDGSLAADSIPTIWRDPNTRGFA